MLNPILVERTRGGIVESFHRGAIVAVDIEGNIIFSVGNPFQITFARSAMKLFQVIPLLELGLHEKYGFTLEEIAIMCGSHNGEEEHIRVVNSILNKININADALRCGCQQPYLSSDRNKLCKEDLEPTQLHNNCSGKHAGFLALCLGTENGLDGYLEASHPIQERIKQVVSEMYEYPIEKLICGIDGCSAPVYAMPIYNQAIAYKNLVYPSKYSNERQTAINIIIEAFEKYPYMIAGKKRYCTELLEVAGDKIIGKTGADGVYCLANKEDRVGVCIKIDDGSMGPQYNVAQSLLKHFNWLSDKQSNELSKYLVEPNYNWNKIEVGEVRVNEELFSS